MPRHNIATVGPAIEDRYADSMRERAIRCSSDALVRAQLRAGQHLLTLPIAHSLAETLGMRPADVRQGIGDKARVA